MFTISQPSSGKGSRVEAHLRIESDVGGHALVAVAFGIVGGVAGATLGEWIAGRWAAPSDPSVRFVGALIWSACIGACLAVGVGIADRLWRPSFRERLLDLPAMAGLGALGGAASIAVLQLILALSMVRQIVGVDTFAAHGRIYDVMMGRALGSGAMGVLVGFASSPVQEWESRGRAAAVGGGIGGFLGGLAYEALFLASGFDPTVGDDLLWRIRSATLLCGMVALGIAVAPEIGRAGRLTILTGNYTGLRYPLFRSRCFVGSSPLCHLRIDQDTSVRPRHCLLNWEVDHFVVYDLTSAAETLVNGQGIDREPLIHGDRLRVGNCLLRFEARRRVGQTLPIDRRVEHPTDRLYIFRGKCPICGFDINPQTGWCACPEPYLTAAPEPAFDAAATFERAEPGEARAIVLDSGTETLYGTTMGETRFALRVTRGPATGRVYPVVRDVTAIGRYNCDMVVDDPAMSRRHALLLRRGSTLSIQDEGSSNGTRVNNQRVQSAQLRAGDRIQIGNTVMVVIEQGSGEQVDRRQ